MLVLSQAPIAGATRPFVKRPMFDQWLMRRRRITPIVGDVLLTLLVALLSQTDAALSSRLDCRLDPHDHQGAHR
jgi:hypothetical protein